LRSYAAEVLRRARENEELLARLYALQADALKAGDPEDVCFALLRGLRAQFELSFVRFWLDRKGALGEFPMPTISERDLVWIDGEEIQAMGLSERHPVRLMTLSSPDVFPWAMPEAERLGSMAVILLGEGHRPVGVLGLGDEDAARFAPGLATDFLRQLGWIVGLVLAHAAARERLARLRSLDLASGARNLRFLQPRSRLPIGQWFGHGRGCACICVVLAAWHEIAEEADLSQVVRAIQSCVRATDPVIRLHGAVFAVLLPGCPRERAAELARRIVERLQRFEVPLAPSAGVAAATAEENPPLVRLIERAERAAFVAEALGEGRVEVNHAPF